MSINERGFRMFLTGMAFLLLSVGMLGCPDSGGDEGHGAVSVTGVALDKSSATILVDGTVQLTATLAPVDATNQGVTWSSSDPAKADVSAGGLVTARAVGSTTIRVTTTDGGKQAQCTVTVVAAPWTSLLGAAGQLTYGMGIAIDTGGNSYVTGFTSGALDGQALNGNGDVLIMKYDAAGARQWTRLMGATGVNTNGNGIAVDAAGNCYVTGQTDGALDGQARTGVCDVFVMKYDADGNRQWTRLMGATVAYTQGQGIAVDAAGNCYVAGQTNGALDGQALTGNKDVFVMKYNAVGDRQWTRLMGGFDSHTYGHGIAVDAGGNSYVTGYTYGSLDGLTMTGAGDAFVLKYNADGDRQWTRLMGAPGAYTQGRGIAVDAGGTSYITGCTNGAPDGQTLTGVYDVLVMKYDADGTKQWTRLMGAPGVNTTGTGIAVDTAGNCYVTGQTEGALDGQALTGTVDVFVMQYDAAGNRPWTRLLGAAGQATYGCGIAVDAGGNSHVTGQTAGVLDGQTLTGMADVFVTTRLNP